MKLIVLLVLCMGCNMNTENSSEKKLSDIKIIDLDKLEGNENIDYDKISQEDSLTLDSDENNNAPIQRHNKKSIWDRLFQINWHLILLGVLVFSVIFIVYRFKNWGIKVDLDNLDIIDDEVYDIEVVDNILPHIYDGDAPALHDDVRKVVLFGNDTFAQNRGTSNDMANLIAELSGATVYNCAVTGSHLASTNNYINPESDIMDAFNLYWLTTSFALNNTEPYEKVFTDYSEQLPPDGKAAYDTLCSIDFNTIDVIGIMYDANDYLDAKPLTNLNNPTDPYCFTGNLEASIELIQSEFPHIRIIVMSPTYAYAINKDGDYVSSDLYFYLENYKLSQYALLMGHSATVRGVSFVDNFYGTINETNADTYLLDNINLNVAGRQKLAERFVHALEYYDEKEE